MIRRALELRHALQEYQRKLKSSQDNYDIETYGKDFITGDNWDVLELICDHLSDLFYFTKDLEGNADMQEGAGKASHGSLWEVLPVFDSILSHFEKSETEAKAHKFKDHLGIQSSITLAWNAANNWYGKTDHSIAWIAALVLHPRFKFKYFEDNWQTTRQHVTTAKRDLRSLWVDKYKSRIS